MSHIYENDGFSVLTYIFIMLSVEEKLLFFLIDFNRLREDIRNPKLSQLVPHIFLFCCKTYRPSTSKSCGPCYVNFISEKKTKTKKNLKLCNLSKRVRLGTSIFSSI